MSTKLQNQRRGGGSGIDQGYKFEESFRIKHGGREPDRRMDFWNEKPTTPKTDSVNPDGNRYSIKNPKNTSTWIQTQVCSVERFCRRFGITGSSRESFNMFFGSHKDLMRKDTYKDNPENFKRVCESVWGIDTKNLDYKVELRRSRLSADNVRDVENITEWFHYNIEEVTRFVLAESFNNTNNIETIANKMAWATTKNDLDSVRVFDIEEIVKEAGLLGCHIKDSRTVLRVGVLDLQMKGSGVGTLYHNMQFKCSYNQIKELLNDEGGQI